MTSGSDAYARAGLGEWNPASPNWDYGDNFVTSIVKGSRTPVWDICWEKPIPAGAKVNTLHIVVWSKSSLGDDKFLGEANVQLASLGKGVQDLWVPLTPYTGKNFTDPSKIPAGSLNEVPRGDVHVLVEFVPEELTVAEKATNVAQKGLDAGKGLFNSLKSKVKK